MRRQSSADDGFPSAQLTVLNMPSHFLQVVGSDQIRAVIVSGDMKSHGPQPFSLLLWKRSAPQISTHDDGVGSVPSCHLSYSYSAYPRHARYSPPSTDASIDFNEPS